MSEPTERDRRLSDALAKSFTEHMDDEGLIVDFWSESNGEGELATFVASYIAAARAEGRREAIEECARLVDQHPFADDGPPGCEDAQGCCEVMAAQIRALVS